MKKSILKKLQSFFPKKKNKLLKTDTFAKKSSDLITEEISSEKYHFAK